MAAPTLSSNALPPPPRPEIIDDKSPHCIPFILSRLSAHQSSSSSSSTTPFIIGLNGVQGAGKTTLVSALASTLQAQGLSVLVCSIDDLYLRHEDQETLAREHRDNKLVQHRGEPGTHDIPLATQFFAALREGKECKVPAYDKSKFNGAGDRVPSSEWEVVNAPGQEKIKVVIFEGWCVGFRSLPLSLLAQKREGKSKTLKHHTLKDLAFINERLREYDVLTDTFDAFIHIDAQDTGFVYEWRLEQEQRLREEKGMGMSDEAVKGFVDGYFPAYELYTEGLRGGVLKGERGGEGRQLRLVVGRDRRVVEVVTI